MISTILLPFYSRANAPKFHFRNEKLLRVHAVCTKSCQCQRQVDICLHCPVGTVHSTMHCLSGTVGKPFCQLFRPCCITADSRRTGSCFHTMASRMHRSNRFRNKKRPFPFLSQHRNGLQQRILILIYYTIDCGFCQSNDLTNWHIFQKNLSTARCSHGTPPPLLRHLPAKSPVLPVQHSIPVPSPGDTARDTIRERTVAAAMPEKLP